jgi:hypothetical protein
MSQILDDQVPSGGRGGGVIYKSPLLVRNDTRL